MATPMTPGQMLAALTKEGVKVKQWPGWRDRCRCHSGSHERGVGPTGRRWGGVNGVMIHHTGSDSQSDSYVRNVLASGYSGLPGPLCHAAGRMNGEIILVGSGRANHAGGGDPAVLSKVVAESYSGTLNPHRGNSNGTDGNDNFYGLESMYDGGQPMTAAQWDATVRYAAAICRFHGWSAKSVIGHGEWSSDKWDPGHVDMSKLRRDIQSRLDGESKTPPLSTKEFIVTKDDEKTIRKIVEAAVDRRVGDVVPAPKHWKSAHPKDPNATWVASNVLSLLMDDHHRISATQAKHGAMLDELAAKLLTADEVRKASEAGANAALDAKIADADVTLTVKEEA